MSKVASKHARNQLKQWVALNQKSVEGAASSPVRLAGIKSLTASYQREFQTVGQDLTARLAKKFNTKTPIEFAMLTGTHRTAYARSLVNVEAVLVSEGLVNRIQMICGQTSALLQQHLRLAPDVEGNAIREMWDGLPGDHLHREALGALLAHAAFAFIVHHELAHLGRAHQLVWRQVVNPTKLRQRRKAEKPQEPVLFRDGGSLDGSGEETDTNQMLEVDADLQALQLTREYLAEWPSRLSGQPLTGDPGVDSMRLVWPKLLTNANSAGFVLAVGTCIALLSLLPDGKHFVETLATPSHPPQITRILLLLHAEAETSGRGRSVRRKSIAASLVFALVLLGLIVKSSSVDDLLGRFGVTEALDRFDEIGEHFKAVSVEFAEVHARLSPHQYLLDSLGFDWYSPNEMTEESPVRH